MEQFPVDFTMLSFAMTLCMIAGALISSRLRLRFVGLPILLMVSFTEFALANLFWSSFRRINIDNALRFDMLTSTAFLIACLVAQLPHRRERFLRILVRFSVPLLLYYFQYEFVLGIDITVFADKPNYQEYGAHPAILFIACLSVNFCSVKKLCLTVAGCTIGLYALVVIGGRGELAFAVLVVPLLAAGLVLRAGRSVSGLAASPVDERARGCEHTLAQWLRKTLLGRGIGEFRVQDNWLKCPLNLPLEILMELGITGAVIFFWIVAIAVVPCARIPGDPSTGWAETVFVLVFLTQLAPKLTVEGYLADERIFFAYMGLVIGCPTGRVVRDAHLQRLRPASLIAEPGNAPHVRSVEGRRRPRLPSGASR